MLRFSELPPADLQRVREILSIDNRAESESDSSSSSESGDSSDESDEDGEVRRRRDMRNVDEQIEDWKDSQNSRSQTKKKKRNWTRTLPKCQKTCSSAWITYLCGLTMRLVNSGLAVCPFTRRGAARRRRGTVDSRAAEQAAE